MNCGWSGIERAAMKTLSRASAESDRRGLVQPPRTQFEKPSAIPVNHDSGKSSCLPRSKCMLVEAAERMVSVSCIWCHRAEHATAASDRLMMAAPPAHWGAHSM